MLIGHFTLQPNEARVLILFGGYHGTVRDSGFYWANPFYTRVRSRMPIAPVKSTALSTWRASLAMSYRVAERENLAARAQFHQRKTEGERQARESGGDRRRGRLASGGYRAGGLRCR